MVNVSYQWTTRMTYDHMTGPANWPLDFTFMKVNRSSKSAASSISHFFKCIWSLSRYVCSSSLFMCIHQEPLSTVTAIPPKKNLYITTIRIASSTYYINSMENILFNLLYCSSLFWFYVYFELQVLNFSKINIVKSRKFGAT